MFQKYAIITGLLTFPSLTAMAAQIPVVPEFKLVAHLNEGWLVVKATAPKNHRFNLKAPMVLESIKIPHRVTPAEKSLTEVSFRIPESGAATGMKVSLYVCDAQNTFCEKKAVDTAWVTPSGTLRHSR